MTAIIAISDLATLVAAILINAVQMGIRWGKIEADLSTLKEDLHEIKGMFVLKLKD